MLMWDAHVDQNRRREMPQATYLDAKTRFIVAERSAEDQANAGS
jgi:hypothetical protein